MTLTENANKQMQHKNWPTHMETVQMEPIIPKYTLPQTGFVRLPSIIGNPKADPPIPPIIPVSKSTWWVGVKSGRYPKPVKLGPRITAWRVEDIRELIHEYPIYQNNSNERK